MCRKCTNGGQLVITRDVAEYIAPRLYDVHKISVYLTAKGFELVRLNRQIFGKSNIELKYFTNPG